MDRRFKKNTGQRRLHHPLYLMEFPLPDPQADLGLVLYTVVGQDRQLCRKA